LPETKNTDLQSYVGVFRDGLFGKSAKINRGQNFKNIYKMGGAAFQKTLNFFSSAGKKTVILHNR